MVCFVLLSFFVIFHSIHLCFVFLSCRLSHSEFYKRFQIMAPLISAEFGKIPSSASDAKDGSKKLLSFLWKNFSVSVEKNAENVSVEEIINLYAQIGKN